MTSGLILGLGAIIIVLRITMTVVVVVARVLLTVLSVPFWLFKRKPKRRRAQLKPRVAPRPQRARPARVPERPVRAPVPTLSNEERAVRELVRAGYSPIGSKIAVNAAVAKRGERASVYDLVDTARARLRRPS